MTMNYKVDGEGYKFLTPYCTTEYDGDDFPYPVPAKLEEWGPWFAHPSPAQPDGNDCGPGRLHVMNKLDARHAPRNWWPWYCQYNSVIGQSEEKTAVVRLRLKRMSKMAFWDIIRAGHCKGAYLRGADLRGADLRGADLRGAYLTGALGLV